MQRLSVNGIGTAAWLAGVVVAGSAMAGSLDPTNAPGPTMHTLDEIYHRIESMGVPRTLSATTTVVAAGFYQATNLVAVENALAGENISDAVSLFGIAGRAHGSAFAAPVPATGQTPATPWSSPPGSDGNLQKGMVWPNPRFTDSANGTVKDNLTGLIWLKDANPFGTRTWANALADCNTLSNGVYGLTDGSVAGDWRLPNLRELYSLIDLRWDSPPLPDTAGTGRWTSGDPFVNVTFRGTFWTSSTVSGNLAYVHAVQLYAGDVTAGEKATQSLGVWPVRGGP